MDIMRKLLYSLFAFALLATAVGCDSDDEDDDNPFEGEWELVTISDTGGEGGASRDLTVPFFQGVDRLTADFDEDMDFELFVDYNAAGEAAGNTDLTLTGTYTFTASQISLSVTAPPVQLNLDYDEISSEEIELSGNAQVINAIFGTQLYQGTVTLTIQRD